MAEENSKLMEIMFDTSTYRGKISGTELTADTNSSTVATHGAKGGVFWLDVTQVSSSDSVIITIEGLDQISGHWVTLGDNVTGTGAYAFASQNAAIALPIALTVYPGLTASANNVCVGVLPAIIRAKADVTGIDVDIDLTLGVDLIP